MRLKKKLKPLEGQTQLSFAKRPEASKHQEQEAANAIEKNDVKANEDNEESARAKSVRSKERRFFELSEAQNIFVAGLREKWKLYVL